MRALGRSRRTLSRVLRVKNDSQNTLENKCTKATKTPNVFLHTVRAKSLILNGLGALGVALGSPWWALGALGEALGGP